MTESAKLSDWLASSKASYLQVVKDGKGSDWTIVMGNEAGDLDSIASAIGLAWLQSNVFSQPWIPLIQTSCADLKLRPENLHALSLAGIPTSGHTLLCTDDVPAPPAASFALVDHNRLLPAYASASARVVAVVDHHDDEGLYKDSADPRIVTVPTGSCSSLVANHIAGCTPEDHALPQELATLLLCAILIDTGGLKPGGKAEDADRAAAAFLLPRSTLGPSASLTGEAASIPEVTSLSKTLQEKKFDISALSARDLLRRDYKQYTHTFASAPVQIGLATVPLALKDWAPRAEFWLAVTGWMRERDLSALGVLTSFHKASKHGKGKGKHKREILLVVRDDAALAERLFVGLEASGVLKLEEKKWEKIGTAQAVGEEKMEARLWKQRNADATRKAVAPLVKSVVEGSGSPRL